MNEDETINHKSVQNLYCKSSDSRWSIKEKDIRIIKQKKEGDFTTLYNQCINDERLSIGGLATLVYIMSKPENWNIMVSDIRRRFNVGRNKTYSIISELCVHGYMKRSRETFDDGTICKWVIMASDKPIFLSSQENDKQPLTGNREVDPDPRFGEVDYIGKKTVQVIENIEKVTKSNKKNPDPRFGEVHPYIQNKDFLLINKENIYCPKKGFEKCFYEFWNAYDNKKGKEKCHKAYKKLLLDKGINLHDNIMYAISQQKDERDSADALGIWQPARKMPLTWLNAHCWEDEVKTREQLNDERQREVIKLSRKPRGMSATDRFHQLNENLREAADRKLAEINSAMRARGEEPDEDDEIDF